MLKRFLRGGWFFYIMSNTNRTLYAGITSNLTARVEEHKRGLYPNGFTARYNFDRLVHFEWLADQAQAAKREKQVKGWRRDRKLALIIERNPEWLDLALTYERLLQLI